MNRTAICSLFVSIIYFVINSIDFSVVYASPQSSLQPGGRFVASLPSDPKLLIPFLTIDANSNQVNHWLFIAPLRYSEELEVETWATETFEILDDGKRLHFVLRKDLLWQDGAPLTADDVEFTYAFMIDPATPTNYSGDYHKIKEFKKIDSYTFEVLYHEPFPRSLNTWMGAILPKHLLGRQMQVFPSGPVASLFLPDYFKDEKGKLHFLNSYLSTMVAGISFGEHNTPVPVLRTAYAENPIGSGSYMLKSRESGKKVVLEANPLYFEGKPYIQELIYQIIPDPNTAFLEFQAGRLDMCTLTPLQYIDFQKKTDPRQNWNVYTSLNSNYIYLGYNLKHPFFAEEKVRQALTYAVDKKTLIDIVYFGKGEPTIGPYKPDSWVYNSTLVPYEYNVEKAKELLAQAGFADSDGDGVLDKAVTTSAGKVIRKPFEFTLILSMGSDERLKTAVVIQDQLKKVGIKVHIRVFERATFLSEFLYKGRFDAIMAGWSIPLDPDGAIVWHSDATAPKGLNFTGYGNKAVDVLLEKGQQTFDQDMRKGIYDEFQAYLHEEQPYMFLFVPHEIIGVNKRVKGIVPKPLGLMYNFPKWYLEE